MLGQRALRNTLRLLADRGKALAEQMRAVVGLAERAPVDVSGLLGPVVLLDEAYARAMQRGLAWVMRDVGFPALPLDLQYVVLRHAALWAGLWGEAATLPLRDTLPSIESLREPGDIGTAGVALGVRLERLVGAATMAGYGIGDFWLTSGDAQVGIGRLLGSDFALATPIDNPTDHWVYVIEAMSPRVPDVEAMLIRLAEIRTPQYVDRLVEAGNAVRVSEGVTLPQIASQALGDAAQWRILAQLNGLRSPYISDDPAEQLGAAKGNRVLAQSSFVGQQTLVLTDASGLLADQQLGLRLGDNWQSVTITQVNLTTNTVTILPALTFDASLATVVTVYNPTYDVVGKVLRPGEYLVLPTSVNATRARGVLLQRRHPTTEAGLYGVDVATSPQGNLLIRNGDVRLAEGRENLRQAWAHRFQVPRGSLPYHPLYGSDLYRFIGTRLVPYLSFLGAIDARQTVLRDPRAADVGEVRVATNGDRMELEVQVHTQQRETFAVNATLKGGAV